MQDSVKVLQGHWLKVGVGKYHDIIENIKILKI